LQSLFEDYEQEMAADFAVGQAMHAHSDHYPFALAGVATGGIESVRQSLSGRGYGHTMYDTVDKVSLTGLREASALGARLALRIAGEENWPVARRDSKIAYDLLTKSITQAYRDFEERLDALYAEKTA
jgi:hypothetical protein